MMARQLETLLVNALAPLVSGRMHPVVIPQDCKLPAIRYATVSAAPDQSLCGSSGLMRNSVQVDVYSLSYAEVRSLRESVVSAMQSFSLTNLLTLEQEAYEPDAKAYRRILQFSISEQEA
jgi:hypothetical protein